MCRVPNYDLRSPQVLDSIAKGLPSCRTFNFGSTLKGNLGKLCKGEMGWGLHGPSMMKGVENHQRALSEGRVVTGNNFLRE